MLDEGFRMLQQYGIPVPKYYVNEIPIHTDFPLVIKADLLHKTEEKAVVKNIRSYQELMKHYNDFKKRFAGKDIIIQKQIVGDYREVIIGIKRDDIFEYFILVGIGGIYTELFKDYIIIFQGYDRDILINRLKELKYSKLLFGFRNMPPINFDLLYDIIKKLERLFLEKNLEEIEINPLLINEKDCYAVDIRFFKGNH